MHVSHLINETQPLNNHGKSGEFDKQFSSTYLQFVRLSISDTSIFLDKSNMESLAQPSLVLHKGTPRAA
jgi:hypothetical protein